MVHRSPVRKFAEVSGGVGHRHKLTKLVEESNNLISVFRCRDDCRNKWLCTVVSVLVCLWENITSYDKIRFRGKLQFFFGNRLNLSDFLHFEHKNLLRRNI